MSPDVAQLKLSAELERPAAPIAALITWSEMKTNTALNYFHIGDAAELVKRAGSKALAGWGRADQTLPDL